MLRLFTQAGMPRRVPPRAADCFDRALASNERIALARRESQRHCGRDLHASLKRSRTPIIPLLAAIDADSGHLYWFADTNFIGAVSRGTTLHWTRPAAGSYVVRAVDERGRSATRDLKVEWVP